MDPPIEATAGLLGGASVGALAAIVHDLAVGVSLLDGEGRYIYANAAALRMLGLPLNAVIGKRSGELQPGAQTAASPPETAFTRAVRRVTATRSGERIQTYCERWDRWYEGDIRPGPDGTVVICVREVTEQRRAEAALRRERVEAESANRTKDELLATLSHELKTPVGIMNVWREVLRGAPDQHTRQRALEAIDEAVRAQSRLVDKLLDVSRSAAGKIDHPGTTVTLSLPLARRRRRTPTEVTRHAHQTPRIAPGLRILVVDDERDVREGLAVLLRQAGARVTTGASAHAALREIGRRPPDVLISDLAMPVTDGYALIRSVRAIDSSRGHRIAAIALTAHETEHAATRALTAGFDLHLSKSVPFILLIEAITRLST